MGGIILRHYIRFSNLFMSPFTFTACAVITDDSQNVTKCKLKPHFQDRGEILFGLHYLPTAQRLSFSMVKINNIKQEKNKEEDTLSKSTK